MHAEVRRGDFHIYFGIPLRMGDVYFMETPDLNGSKWMRTGGSPIFRESSMWVSMEKKQLEVSWLSALTELVASHGSHATAIWENGSPWILEYHHLGIGNMMTWLGR